MNDSTLGSCATIAASSRWCGTIASKEVPSADSVITEMRPVSSVGKSPFGLAERHRVPTVIASAIASAICGGARTSQAAHVEAETHW
jgi:hypothetical protein